MRLGLLLLFIAVPLVELAVLIKIGQSLGVWATLALVIGTAIVGSVVLHHQGWQTMARAMDTVGRGEPPIEPVVDGAFLLLAGAFLLTPGLITDLLGFALLVPPFRRQVARKLLKMLMNKGGVQFEMHTTGGQDNAGDTHERRGPRGRDGGVVIDGEYETVDEPKPKASPIKRL